MKVITTFHGPSAVSHSLKCNLVVGVEHLIIARLNKIEVFRCRRSGLEHESVFEIWGRIISMKAIPIQVGVLQLESVVPPDSHILIRIAKPQIS
jgi:DNA damage-binding protein 1